MKFTDREIEICRYVIMGLGNEDIGNTLHISRHTVKAHLRHLYDITGAKNRTVLSYLLGYDHILDDVEKYRKHKRGE